MTSLGRLRVVSLLPSATEILCSIAGGEALLVGRSHEDNYPASISHLPVLTSQHISHNWTSAKAVDEEVSQSLRAGRSLYTLDEEALAALNADVIITQSLCSVCSVDYKQVEGVVSRMKSSSSSGSNSSCRSDAEAGGSKQGAQQLPKVLSLNPQSLGDVLDDIERVGELVGLQVEARRTKEALEERIRIVTSSVQIQTQSALVEEQSRSRRRRRVAFLEWSDPLYVGGHWTPQLIQMAGGEHTLNPEGAGAAVAAAASAGARVDTDEEQAYVQTGGAGKSFPVTQDQLVASDPDVIIVCPCGLDLQRAKQETDKLLSQSWFASLRAVREEDSLFVVDGDAMFNRPGPRLVDALEWLVLIINRDNSSSCSSSSSSSGSSSSSSDVSTFPAIHYSKSTQSEAKAAAALPTPPPSQTSTYESSSSSSSSSSFSSTSSSSSSSSSTAVAAASKASSRFSIEIEEAHEAACLAGASSYTDPATGYMVFTELAHRKRGKCCGNKCRHCPFGHYNVRPEKREASAVLSLVQRPTLLRATSSSSSSFSSSTCSSVDLIFWSGGKDSLLALMAVQEEAAAAAASSSSSTSKQVLVTHFESSTGMLAHQNLSITQIMEQAKKLGLDLMLVPLATQTINQEYVDALCAGLKELKREYTSDLACVAATTTGDAGEGVFRLVFGDLRLDDVKAFRVDSFPNFTCHFPLFNKPYEVLLERLWSLKKNGLFKHIVVAKWNGCVAKDGSLGYDQTTVAAASNIEGKEFNQELIDSYLPQGCDMLGESGEFHTHVVF